MLDLGCGTGVTLRAFHDLAPEWSLEGFDPNLTPGNARQIGALSGVKATHSGTLQEISSGFDCITCFHVLEHIVNPIEILILARRLLTPAGRLVVQVPNVFDNPFDLTIADHCSHFTPTTLCNVLVRAGFQIELCSSQIINRELTVVATPGAGSSVRSMDFTSQIKKATTAASWLDAVFSQAKLISKASDFGVFGTSIAGTWIVSALRASGHAEHLNFLVDEDVHRIGRRHINLPIVAPDDVSSDATVFMALTPKVARAIGARRQGQSGAWIAPPDFPSSLHSEPTL